MRTSLRTLGIVVLIVIGPMVAGAARADPVGSIRLTDGGPFQIWNGLDAEAAATGGRVLAVIGPMKSLRVNYNPSMVPPQVRVGRGWVDIIAGPGTAMTYSGPERDCHTNLILKCTNQPITGVPEGSIVCMCVRLWGSICCSSDTGIYPKEMIPKVGAY